MIKGYYSIDGEAVIRLRCGINHDITDVWAHALARSSEIEPRKFGVSGLYYSVCECRIKRGQRYYTYKIDLLNKEKVVFYTILLDMKGYAQVEVRYGAQRKNNRLQTGYREIFEYLRFLILEERLCRVDMALTINKKTSEVVKHIVEGSFTSLLSRKKLVSYGDTKNPDSVRLGSVDTVEVAIYDKYKELFSNAYKLSYNDKLEDYFEEFGDCDEVTRIEYRLFRNYLRNVDIDTPDDFNREIFDMWATMLLRYFTPTEEVYDGHHQVDVAKWWSELPGLAVELKGKGKQRPIMFNRVLPSREWYSKHRMMFNRTEGYLASIIASMARVSENVDVAMQIVFRRLMKESGFIRQRALSRFVVI